MTILVALHEPNVGTWIGSDSRITIGSQPYPLAAEKWLLTGSRALGHSGFSRTFRMHERAMPGLLLSAPTPDDVVDRLRSMVREDDYAGRAPQDGGGPHEYGSSYILAFDGALFDIARDFTLVPLPPGAFWARGSGMDFAFGAWHALRGAPSERIVRAAIEAAVAHDNACGGEPWVHLLK